MGILFIIAQIIGLFSLLLNLYSMQKNDKKGIMFFNALANSLGILQYALLGAFTGAISCTIATLRNVWFSKYKKVPLYVLIIYVIIAFGMNFMAIDGLFSLLPILSIVIYGWGIWQQDVGKLKIIIILANFFCVIYDIYCGAYVNCISASISTISGIFGYLSYKNVKINTIELNNIA